MGIRLPGTVEHVGVRGSSEGEGALKVDLGPTLDLLILNLRRWAQDITTSTKNTQTNKRHLGIFLCESLRTTVWMQNASKFLQNESQLNSIFVFNKYCCTIYKFQQRGMLLHERKGLWQENGISQAPLSRARKWRHFLWRDVHLWMGFSTTQPLKRSQRRTEQQPLLILFTFWEFRKLSNHNAVKLVRPLFLRQLFWQPWPCQVCLSF